MARPDQQPLTSLNILTRGVADVKAGADPATAYREAISTPAIPAGMTAAWFTERELLEMRKICRDTDSELGKRFLQAALARAVVSR